MFFGYKVSNPERYGVANSRKMEIQEQLAQLKSNYVISRIHFYPEPGSRSSQNIGSFTSKKMEIMTIYGR